MYNMASSAPFGTDLQPDFDVKVIAGKLVQVSKVKTEGQNEKEAQDGRTVYALICQIFGLSNPQQRVEKILLSCFRRDTHGSGLLSRKCFEKILHEQRLVLSDNELSDLIRTTKAGTGVATGEINYQKLCSGVTGILNKNSPSVVDKKDKQPCTDAVPREPLNTSHCLISNGSRDGSEHVALRVQEPDPVTQFTNTSLCSDAADFAGDASRKILTPATRSDDQYTVGLKPVAIKPSMRLAPQLSGSNKLMIQEGLFCLKRALTNCSSVSGNGSQNHYAMSLDGMNFLEVFLTSISWFVLTHFKTVVCTFICV